MSETMEDLFQSAPPAREATPAERLSVLPNPVSIRASRAGGDRSRLCRRLAWTCFNPRLPRGRRPAVMLRELLLLRVSIRASRAGGDLPDSGTSRKGRGFNPRLPRGRRHRAFGASMRDSRFQSAPPAREATRRMISFPSSSISFNPRLPRGRRPCSGTLAEAGERVSIRASRAGGDDLLCATEYPLLVSIRASRAGGDRSVMRSPQARCCFNPRLPRGRRRDPGEHTAAGACFNPRLPRGRRLQFQCPSFAAYSCFNPRLPRGRRQENGEEDRDLQRFQSAPPAREATWDDHHGYLEIPVSIRASRAGGDVDRRRYR